MIRRFTLAFLLLTHAGFGLDVKSLKPRGYVNDFAKVLDAESAAKIESFAAQLEQSTGVQIAIVTVPSLDDTSIENAATDLFRQWGIGKKGKDEGLLYLLAIGERKQRIELGYGLEGIISDGFAGSIQRSVRPSLGRGDYSAAVLSVVQQAGAKIAESKGVSIDVPDVVRPPERRRPESHSLPWQILIPVALLFLWSLRGGGSGRGGGGGFLTALILGNLMGRAGRGGGGGWSSGGFGGSDGGGGGFGGFGGGDSGGGGASSDW